MSVWLTVGRPLGAEEGGDLVDVVANGRDQLHLDPEAGQAAAEPGCVRVVDVPGQKLVADGQDDRRTGRVAHAA